MCDRLRRNAHEVREQRQIVLDAAYLAHPERFVRKPPKVAELQQAVWINKPQQTEGNSQ